MKNTKTQINVHTKALKINKKRVKSTKAATSFNQRSTIAQNSLQKKCSHCGYTNHVSDD